MSDPVDPAAEKRVREIMLEVAKTELQDRLRIQVGFAEKALAALVLANGGAIVGMFTLIGNLAGKSGAHLTLNTGRLWLAFCLFVAGLTCTLLAHLAAFLSQGFYLHVASLELEMRSSRYVTGEEPTELRLEKHRHGLFAEWAGVSAALAGLALFVAGSAVALSAVLPG